MERLPVLFTLAITRLRCALVKVSAIVCNVRRSSDNGFVLNISCRCLSPKGSHTPA